MGRHEAETRLHGGMKTAPTIFRSSGSRTSCKRFRQDVRFLPEPVLHAHRGPGVLPLLDDGALAGDAAGAALQAAGVVEGLRAVPVDLVQGRGADADQLEELLVVGLGAVVLGQLDVRGLLVDLVLVDGQRLVDVDRDLATLLTAPSPPS